MSNEDFYDVFECHKCKRLEGCVRKNLIGEIPPKYCPLSGEETEWKFVRCVCPERAEMHDYLNDIQQNLSYFCCGLVGHATTITTAEKGRIYQTIDECQDKFSELIIEIIDKGMIEK
jgi:hypothetical protein